MTVAAGLGAGLALALTTRRQWLAERAQGHTEDDTADRRVTELYTMAVGQLGSDNAAVRVGGLYALERLAQDNASHRQTIVEVICGYLRISDNTLRNPYKAMTADASIADGRGTLSGAPDRRTDRDVAELQVRLTAERILTTHLQPDRSWADIPHNPKFWSNIDLDLSGANLVDFNLHNCQVANANFRNATFAGTTDFGGIRFERHADFTGTEFLGDADFSLAEFLWHATFGQAHFGEDTSFEWAELCGRADFHNCIFGGTSNFDRAQFNRHATFGEATFYSLANFTQAQFSESVTFTRVTFHGRAIFTDAQLAQQTNRSGPVFQSARFGQGVRLGDSQTTHSTRLDHAPSWVRTCLHGAAARTDIPSQETRIWFPGWSVGDAPAKQPDDSPGTWRHLQSHYPESLPESELGS
ncbi:Uncharacterised protein [Amycolatopsis camponoti]|uniref:Pentapeptide repeat-containing protein n=2 Tax=Amycolatopsis camponoti TaxID=2606593 RepID=A0A6I8LQX3_9PSEU|nr:Uncharacterised protein [Amycolatopsis camponoti]